MHCIPCCNLHAAVHQSLLAGFLGHWVRASCFLHREPVEKERQVNAVRRHNGSLYTQKQLETAAPNSSNQELLPHALFACAVQSSSQSSTWPPLPGILLEPKAHVQYGDFDKMVLMQVCSLQHIEYNNNVNIDIRNNHHE